MRFALVLVLSIALAASASAAAAQIGIGPGLLPAVQYYLEIPDIPGDSTAKSFENQIEVQSFSWGETLAIGSQSTGAGAGKVTFNPFSITKKVDKSSPVLMRACATGKHFPKVVVHVVRTGGGRRFEALTFTLEDVLIGSYQVGGDGGSELPGDSLTLSVRKITFTERSLLADGSVAPPVTDSFDLATNRAE